MLQVVDQWKTTSRSPLKEGIGLHGYSQRDPLIAYKKSPRPHPMKSASRTRSQALFKLQPVAREEAADDVTPPPPGSAPCRYRPVARLQRESSLAPRPRRRDAKVETVQRDQPKVGRNDPCPCGSGKKYKKCHGAQAAGG
jgi:preprotein translocase subunit SecA